jgi:hypothetical protein
MKYTFLKERLGVLALQQVSSGLIRRRVVHCHTGNLAGSRLDDTAHKGHLEGGSEVLFSSII